MEKKTEAPETLNIYQKLARIRKICAVLRKDKQGYGYTYASPEEVHAKVTAGMEKYHISLIPSLCDDTELRVREYKDVKKDKKGEMFYKDSAEYIIKGKMIYRWVNDDNPEEYIDVPWGIYGAQADPSQAFGSGLTYCERYFMLAYFQMTTVDDDPDSWRSKQAKAMMEQIVGQIRDWVELRLGSHPEDRDAIIAVIKKYAKENGKPSGNYNAIRDEQSAEKCLAELNETFKERVAK